MRYTTTLKQNWEFRRTYGRRKFRAHRDLVTYVRPNGMEQNRIGITVTKKLGKAVVRNRVKRIIRAAYREQEPTLKRGWDLVFVARQHTPQLKTQDISRVMRDQLCSLGVTKAKERGREKQ